MSDERIPLDAFLEELVSVIDKRLKEQGKSIRRLEKELSTLRGSARTGMDKSVLKVLRGE
ncbi:MAG: hypothetical protein KAT35_02320 [Candidatus Aenigmarchaeota archaeon]|nr:hypothetical protein [Candidatus Aenigmarchaeota archaeon]